MIDQASLSNAKEVRGMSEKHDEKCLNPGARPLIINVGHDLRKLHIEHKIRASFLLRHILFLASYPELRICRAIRFPFSMIYVRQSLDNSADGCSPRQRLRPSDFVSALMDVRRKRAAAGHLFEAHSVATFQCT